MVNGFAHKIEGSTVVSARTAKHLSELSVPKRVPAAGRQRSFGRVVAKEYDLFFACDFPDARGGNFRREAAK